MLIGFQTIPSKPHGDAGLDGLSHNGTRGYCCYGLEHNGFKNNKSRERAIVKKFAGDLRRWGKAVGLIASKQGGRLISGMRRVL